MTDADSTFVSVERPREGVALITLNRPARMNAMAFDVMVPLREAIEAISRDNGVRVVVLTGAGRAFCSGADLEDPGRVPGIDGLTLPTIALRSMELLDDVILAIRRMHQPVIAAVNGAAIGGGFCLACAADIRIGSDTAYFRAAGINNGLTANELGISYLLPRQIGFSRAFDILLSGRDVDAEEAERIGLVSRVVPAATFDDEVNAALEQISRSPTTALALTKWLFYKLDSLSFEDGVAAGVVTNVEARSTDDFKKGVRRFTERRSRPE